MKNERYTIRRALWWFWINVAGTTLHALALLAHHSPFFWAGMLYCATMTAVLWRWIANRA